MQSGFHIHSYDLCFIFQIHLKPNNNWCSYESLLCCFYFLLQEPCEDSMCLCTKSVTEVWSDTRGVNEDWMSCVFKQTHTSWFLMDWSQSPDPVSAGLETREQLIWATPGSKQQSEQKSRWKTPSNTASQHSPETSDQLLLNAYQTHLAVTQNQTTASLPLLYVALHERVCWMHRVNVQYM